MSNLVLKIANPETVTVPVTCEQFGDGDKVINTLKLKVTLEKTSKTDWKREAEEADASVSDTGQNIMLRRKIQNIEGLPLERDGQPAKFDGSAMDLVLEHAWIADEIWLALQSINSGKKSDTFRRMLLKN
ncbi:MULTISPECIES: hypothetical protein [Methylobacter]